MTATRNHPALVAVSTEKDKDLVAILRRVEHLSTNINDAADRLERFRTAVYGPATTGQKDPGPDRIQVGSLRNDISDALTDCSNQLNRVHECLDALDHFA